MENITLLDYVLLPFYIMVIYFIAIFIRNKYYTHKHPWRKYFLTGLTVKIIGAVINGMLHHYYYGGGDTFNFFYHSRIINTAMDESLVKWVNLILHLPDYYDIDYYKYTSQLPWYTDESSYTVGAAGAFFGLFTFNTYLPTAVIFAFVSYSGVWAMFRTFAKMYPHLTRQIAIAILFIPTMVLWGSAIYKDTICIFGLGWLTYVTFRFMIQRDFSVQNIFLAVFSFILIAKIKIYILIAFLPALGMWILLTYTEKMSNTSLRRAVKLGTIFFIMAISVFLMSVYSEQLGAYSLEKLADKAEETRQWISYASELTDGSTYSLGDIDPNDPTSMLMKFPQAVNVTLFRPYVWETKKLIMAFSALEAMLFLAITLRVLIAVGLKRTWKAINLDATTQFCLIFAIIFAFAVGVTTYNFGSLSRYKIPCLPFYIMALILIFYRYNPPQKKILPPLF
ncbi:MAG: hypothetical protein EOO53_19655 [Gammaproteobacteria bacterium]|nr:MAG: hypothetical protein EOO53_19655 [Gammaproteobacteria bacterium]